MARALNLLTARGVENEKRPGRHADGGGLYLDGKPDGRKSRVILFRSPVHRTERNRADGTVGWIGKQREMGLGPFGTSDDRVSLAAARDLAVAARKLLREGRDPLDERTKAAKPVKATPTFGEVAD